MRINGRAASGVRRLNEPRAYVFQCIPLPTPRLEIAGAPWPAGSDIGIVSRPNWLLLTFLARPLLGEWFGDLPLVHPRDSSLTGGQAQVTIGDYAARWTSEHWDVSRYLSCGHYGGRSR